MIKQILMLLASLVFLSCAVIEAPYYYNEIVLRNNSDELVKDVKILSMKTNRMIRCANIPPGSQCSDKFPKRKRVKSNLSITWTHRGKTHQEDNIVLNIPDDYDRSIPMRGVLIVNKDSTLMIFVEAGER